MAAQYETWLQEVGSALRSINMPMEEWQDAWKFDFQREYSIGTPPGDAAAKANRFWWFQQNKTTGRNCRNAANCWLPDKHAGECQPL